MQCCTGVRFSPLKGRGGGGLLTLKNSGLLDQNTSSTNLKHLRIRVYCRVVGYTITQPREFIYAYNNYWHAEEINAGVAVM